MTRDPRIALALSKDIITIADNLKIENLKRNGVEHTGPCPICGGDDRFSINSRKQRFLCRHCDAKGDVIHLVRHVMGSSFPDALTWLVGERDREISPEERARLAQAAADNRKRKDAEAERYRENARKSAWKIWNAAVPAEGTLAQAYLNKRGIKLDAALPPCLRFASDLPYNKQIDGKWEVIHSGPALVAVMQRPAETIGGKLQPDGYFGGVHRTWIDMDQPTGKALIELDGKVQKSKLTLGSKKGAAIRLWTPVGARSMCMGEGVETTMTAMSAQALPEPVAYWCGIDLGNMSGPMQHVPGAKWSGFPDLSDERAFVPPDWVKDLWFIKDGDSSPKMTQAKLMSGIRRAQAHIPGLRGHIVAAGEGRDLNDIVFDPSIGGDTDD